MLTSTRLTVPLPDQARPLITSAPRPWVTGACGLGLVMTDFTSISQVKRRALPLASRSVYFEVSSRWCQALSPTSSRRSHFTHLFPSQPGTTPRTGYPCPRPPPSPSPAQPPLPPTT